VKNVYLPQKAVITDIIQETSSDLDIKTFRIELDGNSRMDFLPGQFVELSAPGIGEAPFGFASSPLEKGFIELSIKKVGLVTEALHNLKKGSVVWIRGPFGNTFPYEEMKGSNILFVAGGLGLAPLRPLILMMLNDGYRKSYTDFKMLLAARSSGDHIFMRDFDNWSKYCSEFILTIDKPENGWSGKVGFPHDLLSGMKIDITKTYAITCGPPIMIKFVASKLAEMGIPADRIFTTLEMRMTCGVGKCGKCNIGHRYVCVDGPVFNMSQLSAMPNEY
jgi:sulfhydrogenase subunit gamma (sulfur reductase)